MGHWKHAPQASLQKKKNVFGEEGGKKEEEKVSQSPSKFNCCEWLRATHEFYVPSTCTEILCLSYFYVRAPQILSTPPPLPPQAQIVP